MNIFTKYFRILRNRIWFAFQKFEDVTYKERLLNKPAFPDLKKDVNVDEKICEYIIEFNKANREKPKLVEKHRKPIAYFVLKELSKHPFHLHSLQEFKDNSEALDAFYIGLVSVDSGSKKLVTNSAAINFYIEHGGLKETTNVYANFFNSSPNIKFDYDAYIEERGKRLKNIKNAFYHVNLSRQDYMNWVNLFTHLPFRGPTHFYSDFIKSYDKEIAELGIEKLNKKLLYVVEHNINLLYEVFNRVDTPCVFVPEEFRELITLEDCCVRTHNGTEENMYCEPSVYLSLFTRINLLNQNLLNIYLKGVKNTLEWIEYNEETEDGFEADLEEIRAKDILENELPEDLPTVFVLKFDRYDEGQVKSVIENKISNLKEGDLFYYPEAEKTKYDLYKSRGEPTVTYENNKSILSLPKSKIGTFNQAKLVIYYDYD